MRHVPGASENSMLLKRVEYLEAQERRLTATLNEERSRNNTLQDRLDNESKQLGKFEANMTDIGKQLFDEAQFIFATCTQALSGFRASGDSDKDMQEFKHGKRTLEELPFQKTAMLLYPMLRVFKENGDVQCFMRCRHVHPKTGQMTIYHALVFEQVGESLKYYVDSFSSCP